MNLSVPDSLPSKLRDRANYQNLVAGQVLFHHRDPAEYIFALEVGRSFSDKLEQYCANYSKNGKD